MSKKGRDTALDIPAQCYTVKAFYKVRPDDKVKEIKNFIAMTGQPHMWPGHTHSPPLAGDIPVYLDEFELPEKFIKLKYFAPCPCCTPKHGKFGRGKIAWFPIEGVIRLLGPECFKTLNKEAHDNAIAEMRQRKALHADINFLLNNHDRLRRSYGKLVAAKPVAAAIQRFSEDFRHKVEIKLDLPLWQHVKHGHLQIWQKFSDLKNDQIVELEKLVDYGRLRGRDILKPDLKACDLRLNQSLIALEKVFEIQNWQMEVSAMSALERHKLAKLIHGSISKGRDLINEMRELQSFVGSLNVATLRNWGLHPSNPLPISFNRTNMVIKIGKRENCQFSVPIPDHLEDELPEIDVPAIGDLE